MIEQHLLQNSTILEQMSINSYQSSMHNSAIGNQSGGAKWQSMSSKENFMSRKALVERMDIMRRIQLKRKIVGNESKAANNALKNQQNKYTFPITFQLSKSNTYHHHTPKNSQKTTKFPSPQLTKRSNSQKLVNRQQLHTIYLRPKNGWNGIARKKRCKINESSSSGDIFASLELKRQSSSSLVSAPMINLLQFGIFSVKKDMDAFLKRFSSTVHHQFRGGVDLRNIFDLNSLEYFLLRDISSHAASLA